MKRVLALLLLTLHASSLLAHGKLVLITGASSCGKSSTAKALQSLLAKEGKPYMLMGADHLMDLLPKEWVNLDAQHYKDPSPEGIRFIRKDDAKSPKVEVHIGPVVTRLRNAMFASVAAYVDFENNVILEGALLAQELKLAVKTLGKYKPVVVNMECSLKVAEQREKQRGGFIGMTRWQFEVFRKQDKKVFSLILNSDKSTPEESARKVMEILDKA